MFRFLLLALVCLLSFDMSAQQTLNLKTGKLTDKIESTIPYRDIEKTEDGYLVTYTFHNAIVQEDQLFEGSVFWKMDGFGLNDVLGEAEHLLRNDLFVMPGNSQPTIEVIDSSYIDYQYELTPARIPLFDNDDTGYTKENVKPIIPFEGFQPSTLAYVSKRSSYRGQPLCYATVHPIQYNYKEKTVRAYTSITYKVTFETLRDNVETERALYISVTDNFLNNVAIGGSESVVPMLSSLSADSALYDVKDYLIISTPEFEEAVNRFAEWKRTLGFNVHVDLRNNWTSNMVKTVVDGYYNSCDSLYYLLIVGDHDDVPSTQSYYGRYPHITDYYYCHNANNDSLLFYCGRLSVSSQNEAEVVINKIIDYEKTPPTDTSFYNKGVNCAYFQDGRDGFDNSYKDGYADRRFAQTAEEIRDYVMGQGKNVQRIYYTESDIIPTHWNKSWLSTGEPIPIELLKPTFPWDGDSTDITNALNTGAFYVLHRDHGSVKGWGDPSYKIENVQSLGNVNLLPVVFSLNCKTGKFDEDCFSEAFLRHPNGGCVAIYGATQNSISGFNDAMACGMFDAIWPEPGLHPVFKNYNGTYSSTPTPTYELGQILNQGLTRMAETYGTKSSYDTRYTKEIFHCFGDPSMQIYTEQPTAFENVEISYNSTGIAVSLATGEIARITFYEKNNTNVESYLGNNVSFSTDNPYDVTVCISAHNKIPFIKEGTIYIQNETITDTRNYNAGQILVGKNVTSDRPSGNAVFDGGNVIMNADKVVLDAGTTIKLGTTLEINNQ